MSCNAATVEMLYSSFGDDPDLAELVEMYVQELPERLRLLQTTVAQKDWPELARLAHQMKGAAGSYGFHQITPYAKQLELAARGTDSESEILAALVTLEEVCRRCQSGTPS